MRWPDFFKRFRGKPLAENIAAEDYLAAVSNLRRLSDAGFQVPRAVSHPIIAAPAMPNSTETDKQLRLAVYELNTIVKFWSEAKRKYSRSFYIVLTLLLILQLYSAASVDILSNIKDTAQVGASLAADTSGTAETKAAARKLIADKQATYLQAGQYLTDIPVKLVARIPFIGDLFPVTTPTGDVDAQLVTVEIKLRLVTSFLGAYLLPLLYGMLGAVAFIFRRISNAEQGEDDFKTVRNKLDLRIPVGALAGLAAGWILQPSSLPAGSTLPPLALAFIAGYGAELVFTAMDRIVGAFTTPTKPSNDRQNAIPPPPSEKKAEAGSGSAAKEKAKSTEAIAVKAADPAATILPASRAIARN